MIKWIKRYFASRKLKKKKLQEEIDVGKMETALQNLIDANKSFNSEHKSECYKVEGFMEDDRSYLKLKDTNPSPLEGDKLVSVTPCEKPEFQYENQ